jgi:hypothetical protein
LPDTHTATFGVCVGGGVAGVTPSDLRVRDAASTSSEALPGSGKGL